MFAKGENNVENVRIYLSGGMSNLTIEEQMRWRNRFRDAIRFGEHDITKKPIFFSPPDYYSPSTNEHKSEREAMEFELANLRKSDLVVVNFNVPQSIGTAMELMVAKENRIPIIGLNKDGKELHPWLTECCTRMCDDFRELVNHVVEFYLK